MSLAPGPLTARIDPARSVALAGVLCVVAYVGGLSWSAGRISYDVWFSLAVLPVLMIGGSLVLYRWTARLDDPWLFQVALVALLVKLLSGVGRWYMAWEIYDGSDSGYYMLFAREAFEEYRHLDFSRPLPFSGIPGTGFVAGATAALMAVTGLSMIGGFVVFAFLGFWGQWFAYLAFRRAVPDGHHRRYAVLVLLLPTLAFWPSALGKDAWMQMSIGVALLGASYLLWRPRVVLGTVVLAAGTGLGSLVRPHVAAIVVIGVLVALGLRRPARWTQLTPVVRAVALLGLAACALWATSRAATFVGAEDLSVNGLQGAMQRAGGRTEQGGSEFTPVPLLSPLGPAAALLTVLFRPLPFDAHNLQTMLAALEGTVLLWLTWCWRWSLVAAVRTLRTRGYAALCVVSVLLFVAAFSEFANFGILARQRAQVLPMYLALLCLPAMRGDSLDLHAALAAARPSFSRPRPPWRSR
jgi:hypothetical protein